MTVFKVTQNPAAQKFFFDLQRNMKTLNFEGISKPYEQKLIFILIGTIVGMGLCWANISRFFPLLLSKSKLSYFIHHVRVPWSSLHRAALLKVFQEFSPSKITIAVDDSDLPRCKVVQKLFGVFKTIDKETGGFTNAQNIVVLCLIAKGVSVPIFFKFYQPDPRVRRSKCLRQELKKKGTPKKDLPKIVRRNHKKYPTKQEIFLSLLKRTEKLLQTFSKVTGVPFQVQNIVGDGGFVSGAILQEVKCLFPNAQFIGRATVTQKVIDSRGNKEKNLKDYFASQPRAVKKVLKLRGKEVEVEFKSARVYVKSFGRKVHVVGMRYTDEKEFRFIFGTDMTYTAESIIKIFSLRWLIEVVFQDMKRFIGRGQTACQQGKDGAAKVVLLTMLVDMFLLTHPRQIAQRRAGQPLYTVGAMRSIIQLDCLKMSIEDCVLKKANPKQALEKLFQEILGSMDFEFSKKHLIDEDFPDVKSSPSLKARYGERTG